MYFLAVTHYLLFIQLSINDLESNCINLCRYDSPEVALNCGMMLRECLRHEPLARIILFSEDFYNFFRYVELSTFDIASDAFASFKVSLHILSLFPDCLYSKFLPFFSFSFQDLLTRHKIMCADFLEKYYDRVSFLFILFLSFNKNVLTVSFTSFLNCLTGFHRV